MNSESAQYQKSNPIDSISGHFENIRDMSGLFFETKIFASRFYYRLAKMFSNHFFYNGQRLSYFYHRYSMTWRSERTIEVPIAVCMIEKFRGQRVLEVGNVMRHYVAHEHDVVDRYEVAPGVINVDAADFVPASKYDLILSVSTFEHIGFDEEKKDKDKPQRIAQHLIDRCLAPKGTLVITFPLGHNPHLDLAVKTKVFPSSECFFLKRISRTNKWTQVAQSEIESCRYNGRYPFADGVAVVVFQNA